MGAINTQGLKVMASPYTPSTILFAENLNRNFNTLSQLLYGVIDAIATFYGTNSGDTDFVVNENTGRDDLQARIEMAFKDFFIRANGDIKIHFGNDDTIPTNSIKLFVNTQNKNSYINIGEDIIETSNKTEVKSVVNTNSYVDITTNNATVKSVQNIDLTLGDYNPSIKLNNTSGEGNKYIELKTSTDSSVKITDGKLIKLTTNTAGYVALELDRQTTAQPFFRITLSGSNNLTYDWDEKLKITGSDVIIKNKTNTVKERLIGSPIGASGKTQVNSIWYDGTSTLYFD